MTDSPLTEREVNVAVVGLGFMGGTHLRAYQAIPGARVVAVCDSTRLPVNGVLPGIAGNITTTGDIHLGAEVKAFQRFEDLLAQPEIDLVDICTPTPMHPAQVIAALKAGKNVVCEKPLTRTSAGAREILEVAENSTGILMPAMCMRFWPGWSRLKQVVTEKTYGEVRAARFRRVSEMPGWSRGGTYAGGAESGGALFDLHIHDTDFVNYLFGRPAGVFSTGVVSSTGVISHVVTQYEYPGGPAVHAEGSWLLSSGFGMAYSIYCEGATLDFDLARGTEAMVLTEPMGRTRIMEVSGPDGYGVELEYVVRCVMNRQRPEVVTARDGITALEICEAEEKSLRSGRAVKL
jgi:predicted dehydrogenase